MSEIVIVARFKVKEGREADAVAAFERVGGLTHAEDGCERYAWVRDLEDRTSFALIEKWRDSDALTAHREAAHLAEFRASFEDLFAEPPSVRRYEQLGLGTAHQGSV
jgi:quinol monooxygenase YgiN